ncbi:response regulator [Methylobacter tundripaludum]|uniref:response regulator n=1 Tax=Methylobacter tundripaludum TaxID=173365 RepID=UPI0004DED0AA|nr:response regulator transcription factor [Methylobacter tundripaludum]
MIKVLIVDDHAIVRQGLKQILADIPDMEVFGEAASGDEALRFIRDQGWNIMLLDIAMPGKNVMELIKLAKHQSPHIPILILSMYPEDQYAIRMLRAGADGYLTKESAPEQLVEAIRKVAKGGKYISPAMTEKLIAELNPNQEIPLHNTLTDREFQVFCGICAGKSITDLAQQMTLSIKTISTYRTRLMKKMNMSKNAEIIHYAFKNDLLK